MSEFREWLIKGGRLMSGVSCLHCDGPVPKINESVAVIEKRAFNELLEIAEELNNNMYCNCRSLTVPFGEDCCECKARKKFTTFKKRMGKLMEDYPNPEWEDLTGESYGK